LQQQLPPVLTAHPGTTGWCAASLLLLQVQAFAPQTTVTIAGLCCGWVEGAAIVVMIVVGLPVGVFDCVPAATVGATDERRLLPAGADDGFFVLATNEEAGDIDGAEVREVDRSDGVLVLVVVEVEGELDD